LHIDRELLRLRALLKSQLPLAFVVSGEYECQIVLLAADLGGVERIVAKGATPNETFATARRHGDPAWGVSERRGPAPRTLGDQGKRSWALGDCAMQLAFT
jgi:hypothetical protein